MKRVSVTITSFYFPEAKVCKESALAEDAPLHRQYATSGEPDQPTFTFIL